MTGKMKKKIILLYPLPFTKFNYFQYGFHLIKKMKIEIHDLSNSFISNKFKKKWQSQKLNKNVIIFKNFFSWIFYITKESSDTFVINETHYSTYSIKSLLIRFILLIKNFVVFFYDIRDVYDPKVKKNLKYFKAKIFKEHKFDLYFWLNSIKKIILSNLQNLIIFKKEVILTNKSKNTQNFKNLKLICNIHSFDYSNFLKSKNEKKNKNFFVFLDTGFPSFIGDRLLLNSFENNFDENKAQDYNYKINFFFSLLEKKFKKKILIVPHPKLRGSRFYNEYFYKNFEKFNKVNTNDAVKDAYCVIINTITTSISFAVLNYKPIIFLNSKNSQSFRNINQRLIVKRTLNSLNIKSFSLDKSDVPSKIDFKINKNAYDKYKFKFLQNPDVEISNENNAENFCNFLKKNFI